MKERYQLNVYMYTLFGCLSRSPAEVTKVKWFRKLMLPAYSKALATVETDSVTQLHNIVRKLEDEDYLEIDSPGIREQFDNRPYIEIKFVNQKVVGLLDSGSNVTIDCSIGCEQLEELSLQIKPQRKNSVCTADGQAQKLFRNVYLPLSIGPHFHLLMASVVPSLNHSYIFGSDFCELFWISIDFENGTWDVQSNECAASQVVPKPEGNMSPHVITLEILKPSDRKIAENNIKSFAEIGSDE
ncbi:hypothetical protein HHI36_024053 [Cryptolaemus montrouzieri]|uniref:Uncharacterized protein n=1 Tax=Cryptolaemus montrouzieri TaxID=559131 RepID=A0ABD2NIH0_9CUCU